MAYKEIGRFDLAIESYEGALVLVQMRKPDMDDPAVNPKPYTLDPRP
jgi:hypothetical protein